jgi:hypothetical protein
VPRDHVHDEAVADGGHGVSVSVLQHARRIDGDVSLRIAEEGEDVCRWSGDGALDFDEIGHVVDRVRRRSPRDPITGD